MPSFNRVNYALRPNKNVERKLMVESVSKLNEEFDISKYRYIGLGGISFVDFALVHRFLHIADMISIEKHIESTDRVKFNKPFKCIKVEPGETTRVLPNLKLEEKQSLIWLDYDTGPEGPVFEDIRTLCGRVKSGSILFVSLNAKLERLRNTKDPFGKSLDEADALKFYAGDLVPASLPRDIFTKTGYPKLLSQILIAAFQRSTRKSGRVERFQPLYNFFYEDTAPMVTVGGMIADEQDARRLEKCAIAQGYDYVTGENQYKIDVPQLTPKEKLVFDQLLPTSPHPSIETIRALGFNLEQEQISSYSRFYRHYPVFGEIHF